MTELRVGEEYHKGKVEWEEGTDFNYRSGVLELRMFFSGLSSEDIQQIREGDCYFAFTVLENIIFFMFDFGRSCPLSDNSYSIHMVDEEERVTPPILKPDEMVPLTIILVSSEDGIIRALRRVFLGHDFSEKLYSAIAKQVIEQQDNKYFSREKHLANVARVYKKYPSTKQLLAIAQATCIIESKASLN